MDELNWMTCAVLCGRVPSMRQTLGKGTRNREAKWQSLPFDVYSNLTMNNWIRSPNDQCHKHKTRERERENERTNDVEREQNRNRGRKWRSLSGIGRVRGVAKRVTLSGDEDDDDHIIKELNWCDKSRNGKNPSQTNTNTTTTTATTATQLNYKYQTFSIFFFLKQTDWKEREKRREGSCIFSFGLSSFFFFLWIF